MGARDIHLLIFLSLSVRAYMHEAFDVSGAKHIRPISYKAEHVSIKSERRPSTFNIALAVISHEPKHFGALFLYASAIYSWGYLFEPRQLPKRHSGFIFISAHATLSRHTSVCVCV
jgi:hypothetical protein